MIVGVALGHRDIAEADAWVLALAPAPTLACTHLVQSPRPQVAISLETDLDHPVPRQDGEADEVRAAAVAAHRRSGRAVLYPGAGRLVGDLRAADIVAISAIERIVVLGGGAVDPEATIATRDFVRPLWVDGVLTLHVTPAGGGRYAPAEVPNPTHCCGGH